MESKKNYARQLDIFGEEMQIPAPKATAPKARAQVFYDYEGFVEKFKPKKTTDDCYTPAPIYDAVLRFINDEVQSLDGLQIVRPFWPGKDYKAIDYPANCVVIDNPPFSISAQIVDFYIANGIRFWLFTPHLTLFNFSGRHCTLVCVNASLTYENGAVINTDFVTNLYPADIWVQVSGKLHDSLKAANKCLKPKKTIKKYAYPPELVTSAELGNYIASAGLDFTIRRGDGVRVRKLDLQDGAIFGTGILLSKARAEAKARVIPLSERELKVISLLKPQTDPGASFF